LNNLEVKTIIGKDGRITIPLSIRKELDLREGDVINLTVVDGEFVVSVVGR
jgi:AbrB family looped-hinge helix DNA binding protein